MPEAHSHPDVPPLPDGARGSAVPDCGYVVDEVVGGVYWITDGSYQNAFIVGENWSLAIGAHAINWWRERYPRDPRCDR